jgi:hypothetical protein
MVYKDTRFQEESKFANWFTLRTNRLENLNANNPLAMQNVFEIPAATAGPGLRF